MEWGLAGLLKNCVPQDTAAIDTFLRSQANASDDAVDAPPQDASDNAVDTHASDNAVDAPPQDASELSDEERESPSAHMSWVPILPI